MQVKITQRLHDFWDAGVRGPDFVWAATGPALEAYSEHPIVKKSNEPGKILSVSEFLRHVRRMVVDFVVGRVLSHNGGADAVSGLDDVTTYYLLHRYDFGLDSAPIGPCILYAVSCGLSDAALTSRYDLLARTGGQTPVEEEAVAGNVEEGEAEEQEEGTSSTVKLKQWNQRKNPSMGYETLVGPPAPLIDQVHRLMHLWKAGDVTKVDDYLYTKGLGHNALFHQLLQALIELAPAGSEERAMLESISNHVAARGVMPAYRLGLME
jgi:putative DNA methylase